MTPSGYQPIAGVILSEDNIDSLELMNRWTGRDYAELVNFALRLLRKEWTEEVHVATDRHGGFIEHDAEYREVCEEAYDAISERADGMDRE